MPKVKLKKFLLNQKVVISASLRIHSFYVFSLCTSSETLSPLFTQVA